MHCSRFKKVEADRSILAHCGPEPIFRPLTPIQEKSETLETDKHNYQSDFPENYENIFDEAPLPASQIVPDFNFQLDDTTPQDINPPSPPSQLMDSNKEPSNLFQSQETSPEQIKPAPRVRSQRIGKNYREYLTEDQPYKKYYPPQKMKSLNKIWRILHILLHCCLNINNHNKIIFAT